MTDIKQQIEKRLVAVEPELYALSRWLHDHPETGFREHEASARLARLLGEHGMDVTYPAYGIDTAFVARAGSSGPEIVICAEYDALPSVGHACGHNIIATAAAGAGIALAPSAEELGCRVTVLGTPAEEGYGGKVDLLQAGAFEHAAASMMIHPGPDDELMPTVLAVLHLDIEFHGRDSHAASAPHLGRNALDAFVQAYVNVATLRQHILPSDRIHGIVTHGGDAPNIIPSHTSSSWYIRSTTQERLEELEGRVMACFDAAATATGCTWERNQMGHPYCDLVSNPLMADLFGANAAALGRVMPARLGGPSGSTDMGNVSQVVPTIHPMLAIDALGAVNHQPEFAAATITPSGENAIRDGALAMAWTVHDLAAGDRWGELIPGGAR